MTEYLGWIFSPGGDTSAIFVSVDVAESVLGENLT